MDRQWYYMWLNGTNRGARHLSTNFVRAAEKLAKRRNYDWVFVPTGK